MKKSLILPFVLILLACNQAGSGLKEEKSDYDPSAVKSDINNSRQQFEQAFAKADSAGLVALYHSGAKVYPPNAKEGVGTTMGSILLDVAKMGLRSIRINTGEVSGGPEEVVETGTFELSDSARVVDKGKYISIWKKDGDKWKIYRDMWNSDNPMTVPK